MTRVLNVLLTHQAASAAIRMFDWWRSVATEADLLLVHGGTREDFERIDLAQKLFVDDPRLRTRDHQREMQSYTAVFRAVAAWLGQRDFSHVYFAEYDHLPLIVDLPARQLDLLRQEGADVLGHQVLRVDQTNQPHYLYHAGNPNFLPYWRSVSRREDARVTLSMFGSGSFWTRAAFLAVAAEDEPFPMYLEIRLPTLAHHLGFRVRDFGVRNHTIQSLGDLEPQIETTRQAGHWTLHPVKGLWDHDHPRPQAVPTW